MYLREIMDKPLPYEWTSKSGGLQTVKFEVGDIDYWVNFYIDYDQLVDAKTALIEFVSSEGQFNITGSGNAVKVFSTVFAVIKDFVQRNKMDYLRFAAKEPSRRKLYKHFIKKYGNKFGYKLANTRETEGNEEAYYLKRK